MATFERTANVEAIQSYTSMTTSGHRNDRPTRDSDREDSRLSARSSDYRDKPTAPDDVRSRGSRLQPVSAYGTKDEPRDTIGRIVLVEFILLRDKFHEEKSFRLVLEKFNSQIIRT